MLDRVHSSPGWRMVLTLLAAGAYLFSFLCLIAQLVPGILVSDLLVSFLPHSLLIGVIASLVLAMVRPIAALLGVVLVLGAAIPFLTFSKYASPSRADCALGACLTVITANIYESRDAMKQLSALAIREDADLVSINEAVSRMTDYAYRQAFPDYPHVVHAAWETMPRHMGNPITLLSRQPLADRDRILRRDTAGRAYITADLGGDWQGTRVVLAHAMAPLWPEGLLARNTLLRVAGEAAQESESFIMLGDFNLTPWAPEFRRLPGKRAGDPRGVATWPTPLRWVGLPIDHIMFEGELELVDVRVLEPIGSDHLPVLATFRRR